MSLEGSKKEKTDESIKEKIDKIKGKKNTHTHTHTKYQINFPSTAVQIYTQIKI